MPENIDTQKMLVNQLILDIQPTLKPLREEYLKGETDPSTFSAQAISFFLQIAASLAENEMIGVLQLKNSDQLPDRQVMFIGKPVLLLQCLNKHDVNPEELEVIEIPGNYLFSGFLRHHPTVLIFDPIVSPYGINMDMCRTFAYANAQLSIASLFIEPSNTDPTFFSFYRTSSDSLTTNSPNSASSPPFSVGSSFYALFNQNKSDFPRKATTSRAHPVTLTVPSLTTKEDELPIHIRTTP